MVKDNALDYAGYTPIVNDCRNIMNELPSLKIQHYFSEANTCMNALIKEAINDFCILEPLW